jgi:hypothetical protein
MRVLNIMTSAAGAAALMVTGCSGTPFAVAPPDPGPTAASVPQQLEGPEGSAAADPWEASAAPADVSPAEASPADEGSSSSDAAGSGDGGPTIVGDWIYTNAANTDGYALSLKSDSTYELHRFVRTSATTANDEIETGSFSAATDSITFAPARWSCRAPDPSYATPFTLPGVYLDVTYVIGLIAFHADVSPDFTAVDGCFAKSGTFVPAPLAPVTP